jgi:hypothetical protein
VRFEKSGNENKVVGNQNVGSGNQTVINGNHNISARDMIADTIYVGQPKPSDYDDLNVRRLTSFNTRLPLQTVTLVGAVSFILTLVGAIASLYGILYGTVPSSSVHWLFQLHNYLPWWFPVVAPVAAIVALLSWQTCRSKFLHIFGPYAAEVDEGGHLIVSQFTATCPTCGASLNMVSGERYGPGASYVCSRNPQHCWSFDHTTLT